MLRSGEGVKTEATLGEPTFRLIAVPELHLCAVHRVRTIAQAGEPLEKSILGQ